MLSVRFWSSAKLRVFSNVRCVRRWAVVFTVLLPTCVPNAFRVSYKVFYALRSKPSSYRSFAVIVLLLLPWSCKSFLVLSDRPVAKCHGLGRKYIQEGNICFYCMFKTHFSGHNKIWGHKIGGSTAPECPHGYEPVFRLLFYRPRHYDCSFISPLARDVMRIHVISWALLVMAAAVILVVLVDICIYPVYSGCSVLQLPTAACCRTVLTMTLRCKCTLGWRRFKRISKILLSLNVKELTWTNNMHASYLLKTCYEKCSFKKWSLSVFGETRR